MNESSAEMMANQDYVFELAASPGFAQDGICFAARQSGLYRSLDGGHSWQFALSCLGLAEPVAATALALSPQFDADKMVFAGVPGGILRSLDGGDTWNVVMLPSPPPQVSALAISPDFGRDGVLLAGTLEDGVFRSADRGRHWAAWNFGLLDLNVYTLAISSHFAHDETLFVGAESGIFRSTNGGRAWREVDFPPELAPVLSLALSPRYGEDGIIFAGTEEHGLHKSSDGGRSWSRLGEHAIVGSVPGLLLASDGPGDFALLTLADDALLLSRDDGQSWAEWLTGLETPVGLSSIAAPTGLAVGAPLLLGGFGGAIRRI